MCYEIKSSKLRSFEDEKNLNVQAYGTEFIFKDVLAVQW